MSSIIHINLSCDMIFRSWDDLLVFISIFHIKIGKALSSSENKAPILNAPVARRILICSPSNQTVDELAWKLHTNAIGTDGKPGSFNIIRFGMLPGEDRVSDMI